MGHLDPVRTAAMGDEQLYRTFSKLPQMPRFWPTAARRIRSASQQVVERYQGHADQIWADKPRAGDLESRLERFDGIGQKKASMATRILMDLGKPVRALDEINVSYDRHIRRVFLRAGLCNKDDQRAIIEAARQLNPSFPGILDLPCWDIGRTWCHPKNPECPSCYISEVCPKRIDYGKDNS
jgi:endonuclease III